tara:strand:- start:7 stop:207 length:201 start_codon:yes stop_codon:yes gene_type:complete
MVFKMKNGDKTCSGESSQSALKIKKYKEEKTTTFHKEQNETKIQKEQYLDTIVVSPFNYNTWSKLF